MFLALVIILSIIYMATLFWILLKYKNLKSEYLKFKKYLINISNTVKAVRYGDLSKRLLSPEIKHSTHITENINNMIESIEDRELMIKSYRLELEKEAKKLEAIFHSITEGIVIISEKGLILKANPTFLKWIDLSEKNILNRDIMEFVIIEKEIKNKDKCPILELKESDDEIKINSKAPSIAEKIFTISYSKLPKEGIQDGYVITIKDITALKNITQVHKDFSATLMHDLKVPVIAEINAIKLFLNGSFGETTPTQKQALETMLLSSEELLILLNCLLDTYKYEAEGFHFNKTEECLKSLCEECIREMSFLVKPKNQTINLIAPKENYYAEIDKLHFKRAVKNLLNNASSYSENNGIIEIHLTEDKNKILLQVKDNGKGIDPTFIDKIFDRYFSSSKKFRKVGTGLGLYLTKEIVEKHKGIITVKSKLNGGTSFTIEIPKEEVNKVL